MLVALYSLIKVTCIRNILETYLGDMYLLRTVQCHLIKVKISILNFSICHPYVRASRERI